MLKKKKCNFVLCPVRHTPKTKRCRYCSDTCRAMVSKERKEKLTWRHRLLHPYGRRASALPSLLKWPDVQYYNSAAWYFNQK